RPHTLCGADFFAPRPDFGPWRNVNLPSAPSGKGCLAAIWRYVPEGPGETAFSLFRGRQFLLGIRMSR
ncbi:MAG: hypothetical protein ACSW72_02170, partial [Bacteroidales bacterium]